LLIRNADAITNNLGTLNATTTTTGTLANQGTALEEMFSLSSASNLTIYFGGGTSFLDA